MNNFTIRFLAGVLSIILIFTGMRLSGQEVLFNPNETVKVYDPANPPVQPARNQVGKWVKTNRLSWNTSDFKCFIYKGMAFRLKYPKSYVAGNGVKYPLFVFFHGVGERGSIYDNEYQLYHGASRHRTAVTSGVYDGFLLYPQSPDGLFSASHRTFVAEIIENFLVPQAQVDPFRVTVNGLSGGGSSSWSFLSRFPYLTAAALPMSASVGANTINQNSFVPIWLFQGGLDQNPPVSAGRNLSNRAKTVGANLRYTEYPDRGHDTWNSAWRETDFYPFLLRAHKANPWILFGNSSFCAGEAINLTLGVSDGFENYEWRKDGALIAGANTNTIHVTSVGRYDCRVQRIGGEWSPWSPTPAIVEYKTVNTPPNITTKEFASRVLPSPDGKTSIELVMPEGYFGYSWRNASNTQVSTTYNLVAGPGTYRTIVREYATCESEPSSPFTVVDANGPNKPDSVVNLLVNKISKSSLRLDWLSNPAAPHPATEYEIYISTKPGGPYRLAGITAEKKYLKEGLESGAKYYFVVRAINNTAGSLLSREVSGSTDADNVHPTSPQNLQVAGTSQSSISLTWNESTDDVGVAGYDIYVNGVKTYHTNSTEFTVHNLAANQHYTITVKAKDLSGNESSFSNQVTAQTISQGLSYKYYLHNGSWTKLPDFDHLVADETGVMPNVSIADRTREQNYAYLWEGEITIPESGTYVFRTNSDEGSKLYIGTPYNHNAAALVDNDGLHAAKSEEGTIYLNAGVYPIAISYFQVAGAQTMSVFWSTPGAGGTFVPIPTSAFKGTATPPSGTVPSKPSGLAIVPPTLYNKVGLTWTDNSNNESSFEIFRSEDGVTFSTVDVLPANTTSYQDTTVRGNVKYYYKVRAINQYGESDFDKPTADAVNVTTPSAPAAPAAPTNLASAGNTSSSIKLGWTNNAGTGATKYQLYRSAGDNSDYFLYAELPADATSFTDTDLFANTTFFYKVKVVGPGGESPFSNEIGVTTLGLPAVIDLIENQYMRFGTQLQVPVSVSNGSGQSIQLLVQNLPSFGTFESTGNNKGVITFTPSQSQQGVYNSVTIKAVNAENDTTVTTFSLIVNDNYVPVIESFTDVVMNEWETKEVTVHATDQNAGEVLNWTFLRMPNFVAADISNNSVKFTLSPKYAQAGTYQMLITVKDSRQSKDTATLTITVNAVSVPGRRVNVNFSDGAVQGPATQWNNTNTSSLPVNTTFSSLQDETGAATTINLKILTGGIGVGNDGVNTGNNSGVYPDNVLQSHYWIDASKDIEISGLNANKRYNFTFIGSYNNDDRIYSAKYTIGGESVTLNAARNANNTVSLMNITAPPNGTLNLTINRGDNSNATRAYLTALVIDEMYDDSTPPVRPINLTAKLENDTVKLNWTNIAYNAERYEVYRAIRLSGPFTLLNPGVVDNKLEHFNDLTAAANKTYYYIVRVRNSHGVTNSQIVWLNVPNKAPRITTIADVFLKLGESGVVTVSAVDDPTETISLSATGLPSFATFTDNGGGNGVINIAPTDVLANYNVTITATDNSGASSTKSFTINVVDRKVTSTYINFNPAGNPSMVLPWNDFNGGTSIAAGATLINPKDELNTATPYVIQINQAMSSYNDGYITRSNGGVYPDAIISTGFTTTATTSTVTISGLPAGKYNLVFYGNAPSLSAPKQIYSVGSTLKDTLDVATNYDKTARLVGLTPVNGQIAVTISKLPTGSANIYLGALVIEAHSAALTPPSNIRSKKNKKTSIELEWDANETTGTTELWRSTSRSTGYVKVADLPARTEGYTDNGLTAATVYYYKLRAANGATLSDYSQPFSTATIQYSIDINLNDGSPGSLAAAPWNNTNELLTDGFVLSNMINSDYQRTGVNFQILQNFNGYDDFNGTNTGNNSGIVPDAVLKSFYYIQYGEVVRLKVTGLNKTLSYNFVFCSASTDASGGYTNYIIGDKTVFLDWKDNTSRSVQINTRPDETGSVEILVITSTFGTKGYLNGFSIQALPATPGSGGSSGRSIDAESENITVGNTVVKKESQIGIGTYPNPFVDDIMVDLDVKTKKPKLALLLRDGSGRVVYTKVIENVPAGHSQHQLKVNGRTMLPGAYYLQVINTLDGESSIIKLMK